MRSAFDADPRATFTVVGPLAAGRKWWHPLTGCYLKLLAPPPCLSLFALCSLCSPCFRRSPQTCSPPANVQRLPITRLPRNNASSSCMLKTQRTQHSIRVLRNERKGRARPLEKCAAAPAAAVLVGRFNCWASALRRRKGKGTNQKKGGPTGSLSPLGAGCPASPACRSRRQPPAAGPARPSPLTPAAAASCPA